MAKPSKILKDLGVDIPEHFYKKWTVDPYVPTKTKACDAPHCEGVGEYRAPQCRERLNSYYWFCLDHVREYNQAWDYYAGLDPLEVERAIRFGTVWERPTWPMGMNKGLRQNWQTAEQKLRQSFSRAFDDDFFKDEPEDPKAKFDMAHIDPRYKAQLEALHELGLDPPVTFEIIKKRYRLLVKRHHPDVKGNKGEAPEKADEKIKRLNSAFTVLREFYAVDETG